MGETTAIASGGDHGNSEWGKPPRPRCLPKTALPPQDRAASLLPTPCSLFPVPFGIQITNYQLPIRQ
ncbi:hypothetical protein [Moorena sp. SIO4G3]|uniref:hypothetical protein n=1 Tax=Moorena sp. SIO4G3 TaxID=2607821 RepID=UPI00142BFA98|nr:hypothetical protein [Moorena sp. SIO4G3]NEO81045.1 hypothetical protein [Moorena sp. SIO4G3]